MFKNYKIIKVSCGYMLRKGWFRHRYYTYSGVWLKGKWARKTGVFTLMAAQQHYDRFVGPNPW